MQYHNCHNEGRQKSDKASGEYIVFSSLAEDDIRLEMPPWLAEEPLGREFIQRRIDSEKDISEKLKFSKDNDKQIIVNRNIEYLEGLLNETV